MDMAAQLVTSKHRATALSPNTCNRILHIHAYPTNRLKWLQPTLFVFLCDKSEAGVGLPKACPLSLPAEVIPF